LGREIGAISSQSGYFNYKLSLFPGPDGLYASFGPLEWVSV